MTSPAAANPESLHGLLLLDTAFGADALDVSTLTQTGAQPAQPQPAAANAGWATLGQTGTPDAETYAVRIAQPGSAGSTGAAASILWRLSTDTDDTDWRGWWPYRQPVDLRAIALHDPGLPAANTGMYCPSAVRLASGQVVCAYVDDDDDPGSTVAALVSQAFPAEGIPASTRVRIDDVGAGLTVTPTACLTVPRPGGQERVLLLSLQPSAPAPAPAASYTIWIWASDDAGATWARTVTGARGWSQSTSLAVSHLHAVYHDGYITLLVQGTDGSGTAVWHLVSDDMGATWAEVEKIQAGTHDVRQPHVLRLPGGVVGVVYLDVAAPKWATKATPRGALTTSPDWDTELSTALPANSYDRLAATLAEDGRMCLLLRRSTGGGHDVALLSTSDPATADPLDVRYYGRGALYSADTNRTLFGSGSSVSHGCIVLARGELWYLGQSYQNGGNYDRSLWLMRLGGYSSVDWHTVGMDLAGASTIHGTSYWPASTPGPWAGWTASATGTTASITADGLELADTGASDQYLIQCDPTASPFSTTPTTLRRVVMWRCSAVAGGSTSSLAIALTLTASDGTDQIAVQVRIAATSVQLYDLHGLAAVGTLTGLPSGEREYLLITSDDGDGTVYARLWVRAAWEAAWTDTTGGTITTTTATAELLTFGHISTAGSRESVWGMVHYGGWQDIGTLWPAYQWPAGTPRLLAGRPLAAAPMDLTEGRRIVGGGGPAQTGDTWTIGTRYAYPAAAVDPARAPSPSVRWESANTSSDQSLTFTFAAPTRHLNNSWGVYVAGANWRTAYLEGWTGSAWTPVATIDLASGTSGLGYSLGGGVATAAGSGAATRPIQLDEFAGGTVILDATGTPAARAVAANSEGIWGGGHSRPPLVRVSGSVAGIATTGTLHLCATSGGVIVWGSTASYTKWRLRIPSGQPTVSGTYQLGALLIGPVILWPQRPDWGRGGRIEAGVELRTGEAGIRTASRRHAPRRRVSVSWPAGIDDRRRQALTADYYYPGLQGTAGSGLIGDPSLIEGALLRADGPRLPVVYLPRVDRPASATSPIIGADRHLYGRIVGPIQRRATLGDEHRDEVVAFDAITIEEEL